MQSIYGIWDANMAAWNAKVATQFQYASLTSPPAIKPGASGNLLQHVMTTTALGTRTTDTSSVVCWSGTTACASTTNNQMGWELDLSLVPASGSTPAVAEQVLFNPLVAGHFFNTNTDIPVVAQALTCDKSSETAYSFGLSMATGGAGVGLAGVKTTDSTGATNFTYFVGYAVGTIGVATQATGTSSAVTASDGSNWLVFQKGGGGGGGGTANVNLPGGTVTSAPGERLNWTKMR
jgi:type IV pilus assembly protein PilY1